MDYKRVKAEKNTQTQDLNEFEKLTGNVYETIVLLANRSNQIAQDIKDDLKNKIDEFTVTTDTLQEVFENREQIEIARFYEQLPKPTLIAIHEYLNNELVYRNESTGQGELRGMIKDVEKAIENK